MVDVILKVQRPIFSSEVEERWLIYDEERTFMLELSPNEDMIELMDGDLKMYVVAEVDLESGGAGIIFQGRVPGQTW